MITLAEPQDKATIYKLWKQQFSADDGGYTDYYFEYLYEDSITYVVKEEGIIKASLQRRIHQIQFGDVILNTSMILGVATFPQYQRKGYMRRLMKKVLQDASQSELITMIQAYQPSLYTPFGFTIRYYLKDIEITPIKDPIRGVLDEGDVSSFLPLYEKQMKQYDGTIIRYDDYYENLQMELTAQGSKMIGYLEDGTVQAYAVLEKETDWIVTECIGDALACAKLLTLLLKGYPNLKQRVMSDQCDDQPYTMLKIHDWNSFHNAVGRIEENEDSFFKALKKPLFMHENS